MGANDIMTYLEFVDQCALIREKLTQYSLSNSELHELLVENAKNFIYYRQNNDDDEHSRRVSQEEWLITSKSIQSQKNFSWPSPKWCNK